MAVSLVASARGTGENEQKADESEWSNPGKKLHLPQACSRVTHAKLLYIMFSQERSGTELSDRPCAEGSDRLGGVTALPGVL